ncbi:MAG: hypothetical protein JWM74_6238 [Myxococcaceae bacterium]|nr:hypothetical protein [Myxococcaceae bacterium]
MVVVAALAVDVPGAGAPSAAAGFDGSRRESEIGAAPGEQAVSTATRRARTFTGVLLQQSRRSYFLELAIPSATRFP